MQLGDTIAQALGYQGRHFRFVNGDDRAALDAALWNARPPLGVRMPATFAATNEKRTTLSLAIDHLALHAPVPQRRIALPAGSPFGAIAVDQDSVHDVSRLRRQLPRGRDPRQRRAPATSLHREQVRPVRHLREDLSRDRHFAGARAGPDARSAPAARPERGGDLRVHEMRQAARDRKDDRRNACRLAGHSMFAAPGALDRLKMCADCRVVDLIQTEKSVDIRDL